MNNALSVANKIIELANSEREPLDHLKLGKLVYLAHGYGLVFLNGGSLLDSRFDEVQAWKYGPVIPSVYHTFKYKKNNPITPDDYAFDAQNEGNAIFKLNGELENKIVKAVWDKYKGFDGMFLVNLLHREGTPWKLCYVEGKNSIIPDDFTKLYYTRVVENTLKNARNDE